jgi:hypothetical protein
MGQASVLNESEIRRVFRIIETTRHVERPLVTLRPRRATSDVKSSLGRIRRRDRKVEQ